jgi:hypothetical protein
VPATPPQTLTLRPIKEALKQGDWHHLASATDDLASATNDLRPRPNTGDPTPTGVLHHVVVLIAPRYLLVIPRL